jgi:hypothetical protein
MDKQGEKYFAALSEKRSRSADALEDFALRGAKTSVVEKYSDQAHFIYELLQNADDALATNARFILEKKPPDICPQWEQTFFCVGSPLLKKRTMKTESLVILTPLRL